MRVLYLLNLIKNLKFLIYKPNMTTPIVKKKEDLIYDLIFSDKFEFKIDIAEYVDDIYQYDDFIEEIKIILKKSKVKILKSIVNVDSKTAIWHLKVKK